MDKKTGHILSALLAAVVMGGLYWSNATLRDEINQLTDQVTNLNSQLSEVRYDLSDEIGSLRQDLDAQISLFSTVETNLGYENGMLTLHVAVVPKELSTGETASISLTTGENAALTDDGSGRLTGVLICSPREPLEPVVSLTAGGLTRRETLPTLWTDELFSMNGASHWLTEESTTSNVLSLVLSAPENSALQVETVTVEVRSAILDPAAQASLLGTVEAIPQPDGSYRADLSRYLGREGGYEYEFWLTLVTTYDFDLWLSADTGEGLTLRSDQPVADYRQEGTTSNRSEGDFPLRAQFDLS